MSISCRKCITIASVIGGRSCDSDDSCSVIELEDDSIRIYQGSSGCDGSSIPRDIDNISILLDSGNDVGKYSRCDDWPRSIFGCCDGLDGGIIGFVRPVVCMGGDSIILPTTIRNRVEYV